MGSNTDNSRFRESVGFAFAQLARRHRKRAETLLGEIDLHVGQEMLLSTLLDRPAITRNTKRPILPNPLMPTRTAIVGYSHYVNPPHGLLAANRVKLVGWATVV